jgi:endonuclease/exonuclease/phosphatase family metal-dependent hydrolase
MKYDYIHFVTWNLDFWKRTCNDKNNFLFKSPENIKIWKEQVRYNLSQLASEFVFIQEINPYSIYGINYEQKNTSNYELKIDRNNVFYYEFSSDLEDEKVEKQNYWGSSLLVDEKYKKINKDYLTKNGILSCDFEISEGKNITVINYYRKSHFGKYYFEKDFIDNIKNIMTNKKDNLIMIAGDFNTNFNNIDRSIYQNIIDIGLIDKTKDIGSTMVKYDYQNDHIFVNKIMDKYVDNIRKFSQWNISDHFGIECTIKL